LLENICDHIDGATSFFIMTSLAIIEFSLLDNNLDNLPQKYPNLAGFKDTVFFAKTDDKTRVETCLVGISVLSYIICKREDMM